MVIKRIEDMKVNKVNKPTILKKEIDFFPEVHTKYFESRQIKKPTYDDEKVIEARDKEIQKDQESKIDEYIKSRSREREAQRLQRTPQIKNERKILHNPVLVIFIFCVIFGGIYWGGNVSQKANIIITAKHQIINYNNKQFASSKDYNGDSVNFEIMIVSDKKLKKIILTVPKDVSIKAKGSVTFYNEYSIEPQKLVVGTFLTDNSGKSYKTDSVIIIPGYKIDVSKKIIPGEIFADITSFLPGDLYNGSPTDFSINSFKGTAKSSKIYGKLKSPLVGGASGSVYTLDDSNKTDINNLSQSSLKDDLLKQVKALVPPGYILYPDASSFSYKVEDNVLSKTPEAEVSIEGSLSVVLLKEKSLIDNIIKISLPNISSDELKEIKIPDLSKLSFSFTNKDQLITKDTDAVSFALTGDVDAIWNPDIEILKIKLLGINKDDVLPIFQSDKGIGSALVKISPPWQKYIPNDLAKINIIIQ